MKKAWVIVAVCGLVWLPSPAASSPRCADIVRAFLISMRGELLSVKAKRGGCLVTYLLRRDGKRPMRVTRELRAEEASIAQADKSGSMEADKNKTTP